MAFTRHRVHNTLEPARVRTDGTTTQKGDDPAEERLRARVKQNSAYEKYKASLHEFFDGGKKPLPDSLRAMLATRPGAEEHLGVTDEERALAEAAQHAEAGDKSAGKKKKKGAAPQKERAEEGRRTRRLVKTHGDDYKGLVDAIRKATSPREVEGAIDALKTAGYGLPAESELLSKALGHKDEGIICEALRGLLEVADAGGIKSPRLLRTRIDNVALLASSSECRGLCGELKAKLS